MKNKFRHIFCVLLCLVMAVSLTGTALAFDGSNEEQEQNITIRITPPQGQAEGSAAVEVCVTDNAGAGFQSAQAKAGNGGWRDVTAELAQKDNRWYCVVDITQNCAVQVRVIGMDGTVYEKTEYIQCFSGTAGGGDDPVQPSAGLTTPPGGQGTVIDNVTTTSGENGREFFTIATPDENVFYLVIDRQRDSENVYFLNAVTESDLMALAEKDTQTPSQSAIPDPAPDPVCTCKEKCAPGEVDTTCPVCVLSYKDCTGVVTASTENSEPEQPSDGGGTGTVIIVLIVALAVGGAGWYLKIYKPKKELEDAEDLDELTGGGEEPTVNEDDMPPAMGQGAYDEPDEPDYPDYPEGYGDDE